MTTTENAPADTKALAATCRKALAAWLKRPGIDNEKALEAAREAYKKGFIQALMKDFT